ncbi:hypothetical protein H4582DRAFT_2063844 [Lactarius indigo]|nr:hypothetical protein H4582DRAFT_2063844 [Lactarius indigo]
MVTEVTEVLRLRACFSLLMGALTADLALHIEGYSKATFAGIFCGNTSSPPSSSHSRSSSLHLEKCLVKQKIEEHEITLQVLKEQMSNIEESITSTTFMVGSHSRLHFSSGGKRGCVRVIAITLCWSCVALQIPKTLRAYTTARDELFILNLLSIFALDSGRAARERDSHRQVDDCFRPRQDPYACRHGYFCAQTHAPHLLNGQRGIRSVNRRLTQPPTGSIATVWCVRKETSETMKTMTMRIVGNGVDARRGNERRRHFTFAAASGHFDEYMLSAHGVL